MKKTTRQLEIIKALHDVDYFETLYTFRREQVLKEMKSQYPSLRMAHINKAIELEKAGK